MSALGITYIDPLVVIVVLVSAVYATWRGFVSETLSIFAWAAAAFATLFFGPRLAPIARGLFSTPFLGVMVGYAAIFLVVLIPLSFLSFRFAESVKNSAVGTLDRSLGFAFGVMRGFAIVGLAYIALIAVLGVCNQPPWVANAKLLPVIRVSAQALLSLVPDQNPDKPQNPAKPQTCGAAAPGPAEAPRTTAVPTPAPKPAAAKKHGKKAYGAKERSELDRLIETTGGNGKP